MKKDDGPNRKIESPIILRGDQSTAYCDPAILYHNRVFYLLYSLVKSRMMAIFFQLYCRLDQIRWPPPRKLTPRDQLLNFSSPGNVIYFQQEWLLCLQTYPRPGYIVDQTPRYGTRPPDSLPYVVSTSSTDRNRKPYFSKDHRCMGKRWNG